MGLRFLTKVVVFLGAGTLSLSVGLAQTAHARDPKVAICHYPPDNPANRVILAVAPASLPDHLGHGDNLIGGEVCDLVDNDCDGLVDEHENGGPLTQGTTCGVGECAGNTGFETCVGGVFTDDTCDPFLGAMPEVCDGLDNDCSGSADESDELCGIGEVCDGTCVTDPELSCPCDADLDSVSWGPLSPGELPLANCIDDFGDGAPVYIESRLIPPAPATASFLIGDVGNLDGNTDLACRVTFAEEGPGGGPDFDSTHLIGEEDVLGCAVRMVGLPPQRVLDCLFP